MGLSATAVPRRLVASSPLARRCLTSSRRHPWRVWAQQQQQLVLRQALAVVLAPRNHITSEAQRMLLQVTVQVQLVHWVQSLDQLRERCRP